MRKQPGIVPGCFRNYITEGMNALKTKNNQAIATASVLKKSPWQRFWIKFRKNWQLHLMMLLPLGYLLLFHYGPMYGLQIAFRDYRPRKGIWGSEWVGFQWLEKFFSNYKWSLYLKNTLTVSLYSIAVGFPIPIILALMLHVNEHKGLKKVTQNVSFIPHFISTVILVGIINQLFSPYSGVYSTFCELLNLTKTDLRTDADAFYHMYVWSGVWQGMGWSAIIYVASLSSVSQELHEAAMIDGASRWQRVLHVDIPAILPTICMMLILRFGHVMSVGYEKVYLMQATENITKSEIISTYVYKEGLQGGRYSYGAAIGLMNSVINTVLIVIVNKITDKLSDGENSLF